MLCVGRHAVRVANHQFTTPPGGGPKQLSIYFEDEMGEGIAWYHALGWKKDGTYSVESYKVAEDSLLNLGWNAEAENYQFEKLDGTGVLVGRSAEIVVVDEPWQGQSKIKVKYINDPNRPRAGVERMDPAESMSFAERTRAALRAAGRSVTAARPSVPKPQATQFSNEDLARARAAGAHNDPLDEAPF